MPTAKTGARRYTGTEDNQNGVKSHVENSFYIRLPSGDVFNNKYSDRDAISAKILIASPLLQIPSELHGRLMWEQLNATYNDELALYTVPCYDLDKKVPSIVINVGSVFDNIYYTITPEQLISREVSASDIFLPCFYRLGGLPAITPSICILLEEAFVPPKHLSIINPLFH